MNRKLYLPMMLIVLMIGMVVALPSAAYAKCVGHKANCCGPEKCIPDLSEVQKKQLQEMKLEFGKKMIALRADLDKVNLELGTLMKGWADQGKVDSKIDEAVKIKAQIKKACYANHLAWRKLLTDEQKKALDAKCSKMSCCTKSAHKCGTMGKKGKSCCKTVAPSCKSTCKSTCKTDCKTMAKGKACCSAKTCTKKQSCHQSKTCCKKTVDAKACCTTKKTDTKTAEKVSAKK